VGSLNDFSDDYVTNHVPLPQAYSFDEKLPRQNQDTKVNVCGRQLLHLCKMSGLRIVNGRTAGDCLGAYTCYRPTGKSVVDYMIVDESLLNKIHYFRVQNATTMSDHCLIEAKLCFYLRDNQDPSTDPNSLRPLWSKFIWTETSADSFNNALLDEDIQKLHVSFMTSPFESTVNGANYAVDSIVNIIQLAGSRSLRLRTFNKTKPRRKKTTKAWFNNRCHELKRELNAIARKIKLRPYDKDLHIVYFSKRKEYKKIIKRQKNSFRNDLLSDLSSLQSGNTKEFWTLLNKLKNPDNDTDDAVESIDATEWYNHFAELSKKPSNHSCSDIKLKTLELEQKPVTAFFDQLNLPITISEIKKVLKRTKNGKSTGPDMISYEMLKCGQNILLPALAKLFNIVLNSGYFPDMWNISAIKPLHKKGSFFDCNNYRGISITSCLGKCFTSVLANRLLDCIETSNKMPGNQAAFRKNFRTTDHIFTLQSIVNKYCIKQKSKLYACFVDFKKAFDSVWREALLYKILTFGIGGKFYELIKNIYSQSLSCVKLTTGLTQDFKNDIGIKQGDCLSPILFNLFINDIGHIFSESCDPVMLGNIQLNYLLYADDLLIVSKSKSGLQRSMNNLYQYSQKWHLEINTQKTKAMVFQKFGKKPNIVIKLGNHVIETCNTYSYLGVTFNSSCTFKSATKDLHTKASKALFSMLSALNSNDYLDIKVHFKLFDSLIKPIAIYGSEVWFPNQFGKTLRDATSGEIEKIPCEKLHNMFCKRLLGVYKSTSNILCRKELGRIPIMPFILTHLVKFWSYILSKPINSLLYQSYLSEVENDSIWINTIRHLLHICDLDYNWNEQVPLNNNAIATFKRKLIDDFLKQMAPASTSEYLDEYSTITNVRTSKPQPYLKFNLPMPIRRSIARLRLRSNKLEIVRGKFARPRIPREDRICQHCNDYVDDEEHLLLTCEKIADIREDFIAKISVINPNFNTLSKRQKTYFVLHPTSYNETLLIGDFIQKALQKRFL
jgi:ribosomal protein L22